MVQGMNWQHHHFAQSLAEIRPLHQLCRDGRLYEVERWITEGKPLHLAPDAVGKGSRPKTALQIAIETGQHSLTLLLLNHGYRLELERYSPLDLALQSRRLDIFDLLIDHGAELKSADVYNVLNTYNGDLYERFRNAGYDLAARHEMGAILGHGTSNRPLLGFAKRHRTDDPKIQRELNLALGYHAEAGNERGVNLCLWAGADPHTPVSDSEENEPKDASKEEEYFKGWSAIEKAGKAGHLTILKRLGPDPKWDNFDNLYTYTDHSFIIDFLGTIEPPKDLTSILSWHLMWLANPLPWSTWRGTGTIESVLNCKTRWQEPNREHIGRIRRLVIKLSDYHLRTIISRLKRPEICSPETYQELVRTPTMQTRLLSLGLLKKPVSDREQKAKELGRLMYRYDRTLLYNQVWSEPVTKVAKLYGISGVRLEKVCRMLHVPVPPRGYWARLQNGHSVRKPSLPAKCSTNA